MKQIPTTILLGILSLISFSMGHAAVDVSQFWSEPVIFWLVVVLPTGNQFNHLFTFTVPLLALTITHCVYCINLKPQSNENAIHPNPKPRSNDNALIAISVLSAVIIYQENKILMNF